MKNLSNTIEILKTSIHQYDGNENKNMMAMRTNLIRGQLSQ
jgi:hypothetical protein